MSHLIGTLDSNNTLKPNSFYMGRFVNPTLDKTGISILKSWFQNRLKEYFAKSIERDRRAKENFEYAPIFKFEDLDIFSQELRVLDVEYLPYIYRLDECPDYATQGIQFISEDPLYVQSTTRMILTYQKDGPNSPIQKLNIVADAGEVSNQDLLNELMHPYVHNSEKHMIDVHTLVLPLLEDWVKAKGVEIKLPIPVCYFAKYEDHKQVNIDNILKPEDDGILSKVAAGLALDAETPVIQSHRILILGDLWEDGFLRRNQLFRSPFVYLLNIKAAVLEIAKIHSISYAFQQNSTQNIYNVWPMFQQKPHISYIMSQVKLGLTLLISLCEGYLEKHKATDTKTIVKHLQGLLSKDTIQETLDKVTVPSTGPTTLIHQGLSFATIFFRQTCVPKAETSVPSTQKNETEIVDGKGKIESVEDGSTSTNKSLEQTKSSAINSIPRVKRDVIITDWKYATLGSPMTDIAFLLLTSFPPKARKTETPSLLKLYWDEFLNVAAKFGVEDISWSENDMLNEYAKGLLYGFVIIASNVHPESRLVEDEMEIIVEVIRELISLKLI